MLFLTNTYIKLVSSTCDINEYQLVSNFISYIQHSRLFKSVFNSLTLIGPHHISTGI